MDRRGRGMRPHRAVSPSYTADRRVRRRRPDPGTEEIIRFVREFQLEKQPTLLRLQRRAPLPGIGQIAVPEVDDSGFIDRGNENLDSDDELLLDDEVAAIEASADSRRASYHLKLKTDSTSFKRNINMNSRSYQNFPSRSVSRSKYDNMHSSYSGSRHSRLNKVTKQLPPIPRHDLPERPSAPSPGITPPPPGEELDSAGEPVDFIDPA